MSCLSLAFDILNLEGKQSGAFEVTGKGGVSRMLGSETNLSFSEASLFSQACIKREVNCHLGCYM